MRIKPNAPAREETGAWRFMRVPRKNRGIFLFTSQPAGRGNFLRHSLSDVVRRSFLGAVDGTFVGLKNYQTVFANTAFRLAASNTLRFTLVCMPILIILSLFVAVVLSKGKHGKLLKSCFLMPMALPAVSVALLWQLLFDKQGLLNGWLSIFGVTEQDWMNTDNAFLYSGFQLYLEEPGV